MDSIKRRLWKRGSSSGGNTKRVFMALSDAESPMTVSQISKETGLSPAVVIENVQALENGRYVVRTDDAVELSERGEIFSIPSYF